MATQKYKNIISESDLKSKGPPALYQLKPKKQKFGTLTRITVGEKNKYKKNKTILLVGETGAGKSTLLNALLNYTMGVKWDDGVWCQIVEEEKGQTSDVIVYEIFGFEDETLPYSLTIIDTPGFGDINGTEHDDILNQRLLDLFRSDGGVHEVDAVGLVMKAYENRLSDQLKYILDSVMSLFGKALEKNIVALITHSDGVTPENVLKALEERGIKCAKNDNQPVHFMFNSQKHTDRKKNNLFGLKMAWDVTEYGMKEFTEFLEKIKPQKLKVVSQALRECIRLTACIQNLQERIKFTEVQEREIQLIKEALEKNEEFTEFQVYQQLESIRERVCELSCKAAVTCTVCEENCHYPGSTMALDDCEVIVNGFCTSCTGKCPVSKHSRAKKRYVTRIRKVEKKETEIKQQDEKNKPESEKKLSLLENLGKKVKQLTEKKSKLVDEAYNHVIKLDHVTPKDDSLSSYILFDFLIKKMDEKGDTGKTNDLKEIERSMDKGTKEELQSKLISSRYDYIFSNSFKILSETPAVYQLRPKKEMIGTLTRLTFGKKNPYKINKTILLVGETGAGKSTVINALVNYTMGVNWEDEVWFQIVEEEKESNYESQTTDVIVYEIFGFEDENIPYSLTIIDTPGFGDTRGTEHDEIINERLLDLFRAEDGVHEVDAVGLVMKASENRLSDRLRYIFDSVMSLFGKDLEKNIVALITHSDGKRPDNPFEALEGAKIKCAKNEKKEPVHFLFDNCQHKPREDARKDDLKRSWDLTLNGIIQCMLFLERSTSQKLKHTVKVLKERIRLKACIQNLQDRIKITGLKQTEIRQTQEALKKHEEEMKKNEKFTVGVDEVNKIKKPIDGGMRGLLLKGATCCTVCEENCHYPGCTIARKPEHCEVMRWGRCTSCTNKCPASAHVKENWRYVTKTKKVQITIEEMKEKYEKNKLESENKSSLLENLTKQMKELTEEKSQFLNESYQHIVKLEQIALKADSVSTFVYLGFLIEKLKEQGDTEKVQKLEEIKKRVDEKFTARLRKFFKS